MLNVCKLVLILPVSFLTEKIIIIIIMIIMIKMFLKSNLPKMFRKASATKKKK